MSVGTTVSFAQSNNAKIVEQIMKLEDEYTEASKNIERKIS
jgi:hypothetical protein